MIISIVDAYAVVEHFATGHGTFVSYIELVLH